MGLTAAADGAPMTVFDEATSVRPAGPGRYEVRPDDRFAIAGAVNGGVLLASMLRAVLDSSPHPYPVATSAHFLRAPRPEPASIEVTWLKQGKVAATARATLIQDDRPVLETTVTTGALGDPADVGGLSWTGEPPWLPPIEECDLDPGRTAAPRPSAAMPSRSISGWTRPRRAGPGAGPRVRRRCAATSSCAEPRDPDAYLLALAVDSLPPVVFGLARGRLVADRRADLVHARGARARAAARRGPLPPRQRRLVRRGSRGLGQRGPPGRAEPSDRARRPGLNAARP